MQELRESGQLKAWLEDKDKSVRTLFRRLLDKGVDRFQAEDQAVEAYLDLEVEPEMEDEPPEPTEDETTE